MHIQIEDKQKQQKRTGALYFAFILGHIHQLLCATLDLRVFLLDPYHFLIGSQPQKREAGGARGVVAFHTQLWLKP